MINVFTFWMAVTITLFSLSLNSREPVKLIAKEGLRYEAVSGELFTGTYERFSESNVLLEKSTYKEGKKNGYSKWYSPEGQLMAKRTYKKGKLHGRFEDYYENGQLASSGTYKNQKREGPFTSYHKNGNLKKEFVYQEGLRNGSWKEYYESGELFKSGMALKGVDKTATLFDRDGNVLDQFRR